jgi:hypothetical protein
MISARAAVLPSGIVGTVGSMQADCAKAGTRTGADSAGTAIANSKSARFISTLLFYSQARFSPDKSTNP